MSQPHQRPPVRIGPAPETATAIVIAVHGRDQSAGYMVEHLVDRINRPDIAWILPRADNQAWYQGRAGDPIETNQAELDAALDALEALQGPFAPGASQPPVLWIGFSQGACVVAELLATRSVAWDAAVILTGTLLGEAPASRSIDQHFGRKPIHLGLGDADPWMPVEAAEATASTFTAAGATLSVEVTRSNEHRIHDLDIAHVSQLLDGLTVDGRQK